MKAHPVKNIMQVTARSGHIGVLVIERDADGVTRLTVTAVDPEDGCVTVEKATCTFFDDEETAARHLSVWDLNKGSESK